MRKKNAGLNRGPIPRLISTFSPLCNTELGLLAARLRAIRAALLGFFVAACLLAIGATLLGLGAAGFLAIGGALRTVFLAAFAFFAAALLGLRHFGFVLVATGRSEAETNQTNRNGCKT